MATGCAYSCCVVKICSKRTIQKSGATSQESRYYLSSQQAHERTPEQWINLSRDHWAGVENRNHYRRDATMGEDATRLSNPRALANLALLRSAALGLIRPGSRERSLPALIERFRSNPSFSLDLIQSK